MAILSAMATARFRNDGEMDIEEESRRFRCEVKICDLAGKQDGHNLPNERSKIKAANN